MSYRSIDNIKNVIESTGLSISYLYDDLIFVKHNAYILRFDDDRPNHFFLHFNVESDEKERPKVANYLQVMGKSHSTEITLSSNFHIVPDKDETFQIHFAERKVENA